MKSTIVIDAGHGGYDNGASYGERKEKDDNLRLSLAVGKLLQERGFSVVYLRENDVYQSPTEKANLANDSGADYFISFHRNSSPGSNLYNGVETLVYNDAGVTARLARDVNRAMEQVGYDNLGVSVRKDLAVLRRTKMPAILIEAGFLNSDSDNQIFDDNFSMLAGEIASAIASVLEENDASKGLYGVQVGLYRRFENAQYMLEKLIESGYSAQIKEWGEYFSVVVGGEPTLEAARLLERQLKLQGYDTLIVNR